MSTPPRTIPRPRPAAIAGLIAGLAVALGPGCARDLEVPPPPAGPRLSALRPDHAYAGELVEIRGDGFDDEAAANQVDFPHASGRAVARTSGGIMVRVPDDAGSGAVTVTTPKGLSDPLRGFRYRGLGQLRTGQVIQAAPLLHRPRALLSAGADPVIDSTLFQGLVGTGATPFAWRRSHQAPVATGGSIYLVDEAGALVRAVPGTGPVATLTPTEPPDQLGIATGGSQPLLITATTGGDSISLATFDLDLVPVLGPSSVALRLQSALVDSGDGRLVTLAEDPLGEVALTVHDPRTAPAGLVRLAAPPVAIQATPVALAVGTASTVRFAAVALADGSVGVAGLGGAAAWRVATYSTSPIDALVVAGGLVVVAKAADGLVIGLDPLARQVVWALDLPRPTALLQAGGVVWAAGDLDNDLVAIDPSAGRLLGRRSADLGAAAPDPLAGLAYQPASTLAAAAVAFPVTRPAALVAWRFDGGDPQARVQAITPGLVSYDGTLDGFWISDGAALVRGQAGDAAPAAGQITIPGGVEALRTALAGPVTLSGSRLSVLSGDALRPLVDDLAGGVAAPAISADGRVLLVGTQGGVERARLWSADAVAAGGPPTLDLVLPGLAMTGAFIDGEPWVSWLDPVDLTTGTAARLTDAGGLANPVAGLLPEGLVSPNGRTVVSLDTGLLGGGLTSIRVVSLNPLGGFATLRRVQLPAPGVGLAFDETGERLLVVTRAPDQLVVVE